MPLHSVKPRPGPIVLPELPPFITPTVDPSPLTPSPMPESPMSSPQQRTPSSGSPSPSPSPTSWPTPPAVETVLGKKSAPSPHLITRCLADLRQAHRHKRDIKDIFPTFVALVAMGQMTEAANALSWHTFQAIFADDTCIRQLRAVFAEAPHTPWPDAGNEFDKQIAAIKAFSLGLSQEQRATLARCHRLGHWPRDPFGLRDPGAIPHLEMPKSVDDYPAYFERFNMAPSPAWRPDEPLSRAATLGELARVNNVVTITNPSAEPVRITVRPRGEAVTHELPPGDNDIAIDPSAPLEIAPEATACFLNPTSNEADAWESRRLTLSLDTEERLPVIFPDVARVSKSVLRNTARIYAPDQAPRTYPNAIPRLVQAFKIRCG